MRLLLSAVLLASTLPAQSQYDLVIEGGRIVDGTGNAWFHGDVGIRAGRILRIVPPGMLRSAAAKQRIDASGLVVAPGFIDIQSHSRTAFLEGDARVLSKVTQGITTEIMGEGWTNAPANDKTMAAQGQTGRAPTREFTGARGFDQWLLAMGHVGQLRIVPRRRHGARVCERRRSGRTHGDRNRRHAPAVSQMTMVSGQIKAANLSSLCSCPEALRDFAGRGGKVSPNE